MHNSTAYLSLNANDHVQGEYMGIPFAGTIISTRIDTMNFNRRHVHIQLDTPFEMYGEMRERLYLCSVDAKGHDGVSFVVPA